MHFCVTNSYHIFLLPMPLYSRWLPVSTRLWILSAHQRAKPPSCWCVQIRWFRMWRDTGRRTISTPSGYHSPATKFPKGKGEGRTCRQRPTWMLRDWGWRPPSSGPGRGKPADKAPWRGLEWKHAPVGAGGTGGARQSAYRHSSGDKAADKPIPFPTSWL